MNFDAANSRRGVQRNDAVLVRFTAAEMGKLREWAQAEALGFELSTAVRCLAMTVARDYHGPAGEGDPRQVPLPLDPVPVPEARKARRAEAPARGKRKGPAKLAERFPIHKETPTIKKQARKGKGKASK